MCRHHNAHNAEHSTLSTIAPCLDDLSHLSRGLSLSLYLDRVGGNGLLLA
jgi:hypothetical protein